MKDIVCRLPAPSGDEWTMTLLVAKFGNFTSNPPGGSAIYVNRHWFVRAPLRWTCCGSAVLHWPFNFSIIPIGTYLLILRLGINISWYYNLWFYNILVKIVYDTIYYGTMVSVYISAQGFFWISLSVMVILYYFCWVRFTVKFLI